MNRTDKQIREFFKQNAPQPEAAERFVATIEERLDAVESKQERQIRELLEEKQRVHRRARRAVIIAFCLGISVGAILILLYIQTPALLENSLDLEVAKVGFTSWMLRNRLLLLTLIPALALILGLSPIARRR